MMNELPMRIALGQTNQLTPEIIQFAHQCGITDIQFNMFHGSSPARRVPLGAHGPAQAAHGL
ncbi:MAG: hypothetical protein R2867_28295 [Caldilineaceae bacterium]